MYTLIKVIYGYVDINFLLSWQYQNIIITIYVKTILEYADLSLKRPMNRVVFERVGDRRCIGTWLVHSNDLTMNIYIHIYNQTTNDKDKLYVYWSNTPIV